MLPVGLFITIMIGLLLETRANFFVYIDILFLVKKSYSCSFHHRLTSFEHYYTQNISTGDSEKWKSIDVWINFKSWFSRRPCVWYTRYAYRRYYYNFRVQTKRIDAKRPIGFKNDFTGTWKVNEFPLKPCVKWYTGVFHVTNYSVSVYGISQNAYEAFEKYGCLCFSWPVVLLEKKTVYVNMIIRRKSYNNRVCCYR